MYPIARKKAQKNNKLHIFLINIIKCLKHYYKPVFPKLTYTFGIVWTTYNQIFLKTSNCNRIVSI